MTAEPTSGAVEPGVPLLDAHCHSIVPGDLDLAEFDARCTEADWAVAARAPGGPAAGLSLVDSQAGLAVRRWCAPVLGLERHAGIDEYLARRRALGWREAAARLMRAAGLSGLLVDTGLGPVTPGGPGDPLLDLRTLGELAAAPVREVVRLERIAEQVAAGCDAAGFANAFREELSRRVPGAVAVKSIVAYRHGLAIPDRPPTPAEVTRAAAGFLGTGRTRLTDPVLLAFLLWTALETRLPVQLHTGFGDRDVALCRADPAVAQPFLAAIEPAGVPVILLHCYPYHRQAGWLASVYPHVYVDVGLTVAQLGTRAGPVLGEFCELAPFGKLLFSTDAYALPELYLVGAAQFRHALRGLLDGWRREDAVSIADAERIAAGFCSGNAARVYRL